MTDVDQPSGDHGPLPSDAAQRLPPGPLYFPALPFGPGAPSWPQDPAWQAELAATRAASNPTPSDCDGLPPQPTDSPSQEKEATAPDAREPTPSPPLDGDGQPIPEDYAPAERGGPVGVTEHDYPDPARLGLMLLAVRDGVTETAKRRGVPRRTLQHWLEDYGGVKRVQAWLQAETAGAFLRFEQAIYAAAIRQLEGGTINQEELGMTLRKLIDARAILPAQAEVTAGQPAGQGAAAAAQANISIRILDDAGHAEVIELPAPPPDQDEPG